VEPLEQNWAFLPYLFRSVRVRAEESGTNIGVFGDFSPRRAKDHLGVPSETASAIESKVYQVYLRAYALGTAQPVRTPKQADVEWCRILQFRDQDINEPNVKAFPLNYEIFGCVFRW
jgi:hypothetical protein